MHVINLGLLYGTNASALVMLCEDKFFDGDNFREQLESAYDDFKSFTKAKKISHSQKMFTPRLVVKKDGQLLMTGKAYNNRVIAEWLHDVVQRARGSSTDPRMPLAYLCMIL
ncbi:unnamed protein product [Durusdinium trenchii]|uniref:Uncharacterized protein n=1 Tax=Durusdinium trenchii TaxID=1381693 RepID=A0ABP0NBE2_9DINO